MRRIDAVDVRRGFGSRRSIGGNHLLGKMTPQKRKFTDKAGSTDEKPLPQIEAQSRRLV
jgi:hypothetical protein